MKEKYLEICVREQTFPVRQREVEQILIRPMITRIPFGNPLVYGILFDGRETVPLLDLSRGSFGEEEDFGRSCILLKRGTQKLAAAISEVRDAFEEEAEGDREERELFELFSRELPEQLPEDNGCFR